MRYTLCISVPSVNWINTSQLKEVLFFFHMQSKNSIIPKDPQISPTLFSIGINYLYKDNMKY